MQPATGLFLTLHNSTEMHLMHTHSFCALQLVINHFLLKWVKLRQQSKEEAACKYWNGNAQQLVPAQRATNWNEKIYKTAEADKPPQPFHTGRCRANLLYEKCWPSWSGTHCRKKLLLTLIRLRLHAASLVLLKKTYCCSRGDCLGWIPVTNPWVHRNGACEE